MLYSISATATFSSSHETSEPTRCLSEHGHDFVVEVTVTNDTMDHGIPRGGKGLEDALRALVREFDHRPLGPLVPTELTVPGLAAYFVERLISSFPFISSVSVSDGRGAKGTVTLR